MTRHTAAIQTAASAPHRVDVHAITDAGVARRVAVRLAAAHGMATERIADFELLAAELATNLARHADHGALLIRSMDPARRAMEIISIDAGPGITDVAACMVDGYSTHGTSGTGLGAANRLSTRFAIQSTPSGTLIVAEVDLDDEPQLPAFALGGVCLPCRWEVESGDAWRVARLGDGLRAVVVDGLGHGPRAAEAAHAAMEVFENEVEAKPLALLRSMHGALRATRGAAVAIVDVTQGEVTFSSVGNIAGRIVLENGESRGLVSLSGTVGAALPSIRSFETPLPRGADLVVHTDGVKRRWSNDMIAPYRQMPPSMVAGVLVRDSRRLHDDATAVVVRCLTD